MEEKYINRYFPGSHQSYFLFGPRGTGKSTWLQKNIENSLIIDLLQPDRYRELKAKPERLKQLIQGNFSKRIIILDEVQRIPEVLSVVHALMESNKELQFILTGSGSRKIKRSGMDLLGGRALKNVMHPFMASELGALFQFKQALQTGLIPVHYFKSDPEKSIYAYIDLYISEEIQMEGRIRNIGNFNRVLEAVGFFHGSVLNVSNVARECHVERKTVEGYLRILYELLIAYTIPVFTKRAKRILMQHPKFYFFDVGVYRALRPKGPLDNVHEIDGPALEGLVAQHLRAWIDYSQQRGELYYWRTKSGVEVDFVVYGDIGFYAIEVKNTDTIRNADIKSLKSFCTDYPEAKAIFVYRGSDRRLIDDVLCIPAEEFLLNIVPNSPLIKF